LVRPIIIGILKICYCSYSFSRSEIAHSRRERQSHVVIPSGDAIDRAQIVVGLLQLVDEAVK